MKLWISGTGCVLLVGAALLTFYGCAPAVVGGAAVGAYAVGTDERPIKMQLDDAGISLLIKKEFMKDREIKAFTIDVDTFQGMVTLNGVVANENQSRRAVEIAGSVEGVKLIKNNLQLRQ